MNPQDPFQPIKTTPPKMTTPSSDDSTRHQAADIARDQIGQIFGSDGQPNTTLSHTNKPMIHQSPSDVARDSVRETNSIQVPGRVSQHSSQISSRQSTAKSASPKNNTAKADNPYDRTHKPTSNTNVEDSHKHYHEAWQQYYQKYYEKYYIDAMEEQKQKFAQGKANIAAPATTNGSISQSEAVEELRNDIVDKIKQGAGRVRKSRHFVPVVAAIFVILIAAFVQYNGVIFAQVSSFISPGATTSQDIIVGTGSNEAVSSDPKVIIPKINVSAPIIFDLADLSEASSQEALQRGVIHYPISGASAYPGQNGNTVLLGHSSSDFFKPGNYKFIFVQLNRLESGDLFYINYNSKRYTYKVFKTEIISPTDISKLAIGTDKPYATLITCDPPGSATNRLVVYGEQISPDPSSATDTQTDSQRDTSTDEIVGNPPTLFEQIFGS